jgi:hypothetical protein
VIDMRFPAEWAVKDLNRAISTVDHLIARSRATDPRLAKLRLLRTTLEELKNKLTSTGFIGSKPSSGLTDSLLLLLVRLADAVAHYYLG